MKNQLYYGDNLDILRKFPDEHVDLIYLDPPFNSKRDYNIIFQDIDRTDSQAQKLAFADTWSNVNVSETLFQISQKNQKVFEFLKTLQDLQLDNSSVGYLSMMAARLIELHRVLKSTGSLYLHCDPTMSHYLKIILDLLFGKNNFKNEII